VERVEGSGKLDQPTRRFSRISQTNLPTRSDFTSHAEKGKRPREKSAEAQRLWTGISVYDTLRRARKTAQLFPHLGLCIAELQIPLHGPIVWERTTRSFGHYTLWGDPDTLVACVTALWSPTDTEPGEKGTE
jgi:hypothetical protein